MLNGIHPLLSGGLLLELDRLGHGDTLVVADANFPSFRLGTRVVELPGTDSPSVVRAVRTVIPLDEYEEESVTLMRAEYDDFEVVQLELLEAANVLSDRVAERERFAFYDLAASAQLIIRSGETRAYGNLAIRKGVVTFPPA